MYYDTWLAIQYKNDMGSFTVIWYNVIQWLEINIVTFCLPKIKGKKCLFLCSGRGGKTLGTLDTLKFTNIQSKASIQSVWTTKANCKSLVLLLLPCHDPPLSDATLLMQYACPECHRMNWNNVYDYEQLQVQKIHPHNNVWHAKHKALIFRIDTVDFFFEKPFKINTSHTRRTICRLICQSML